MSEVRRGPSAVAGLAGLAALLALALALGTCGGDGGSRDVPDDAVAVVGDAEISDIDLALAMAALRRAQVGGGGAAQHLPGMATKQARGARQLEEQALSLLLQAEAIEQEAAIRDVDVSSVEARRQWRSLARTDFPTRAARRRFLGQQRVDDIVAQLRLQMMLAEIQTPILRKVGGGPQGSTAIRRFMDKFHRRWRSRTTCRDDLDVAGCP